MSWIVLTILAILSRSVYSIAVKLLSSKVKVSPITQAVFLTSFAGLLSLLLSPFVGGISFAGLAGVWPTALLMVLSQAFGNILFFKGVKQLDAGTAQIAFSSILIWVAILSLAFLGSSFSVIQILGIVLMMLAILLSQYKKGGLTLNKGILYIIMSTGLFAVFQVTSARIADIVSTGAYLLIIYFGSSLTLASFYPKTILEDLKSLNGSLRKSSLNALFASGTSLLFFLFSYLVYQTAPDRGAAMLLFTSQVILSVLLGIIFLKEKQNLKQKILAGILAFVAAVLIKV